MTTQHFIVNEEGLKEIFKIYQQHPLCPYEEIVKRGKITIEIGTQAVKGNEGTRTITS